VRARLVAGIENGGAGGRVGVGEGNVLESEVFVAGLMPDMQVNMQNKQFYSSYRDDHTDDEANIQIDIYG
jgi:hypothetical protein